VGSAAPPEHPEWLWRLRAARDSLIPWVQEHIPLAGLTVLEYGCGQGAISCALAPHVSRHIGVDIDAGEIALAQEHLDRRGHRNVTLSAPPPSDILDLVATFTGEVDVFLLYAVLEHMTVAERLAVLRLARTVTRADGYIVVIETPNRLTPIDHHTSRMPFLHALPLDLARQTYCASDRRDFLDAIDAASKHGDGAVEEALVRWGRGVSYHEFELVFGDLTMHTVASNYDERLYPYRPVRWEELQLAATLEAWRPDLPPCWSRTWLDTILAVTPRPEAGPHVRPWPLRLEHDVSGAAMLPDGRIELRPGARLPVRLPAPTGELHVGLMADEPTSTLRVHAAGRAMCPVAAANHDGVPPWHACVHLPDLAQEFELELVNGGCLTYVGYRGAPDPDATMRRPMGW
jgi:SAM-dependent methyltransferase